jgi:quercetin dioxygenase-like cupin family protein
MAGTFVLATEVIREKMDRGERGWLSRPSTTGATQLVVIEASFAPGGCHSFHKHPDQEEVLYVISGTVEQWIGEEKRAMSAGDSCFIPKDTVHAAFNDAAREARVLAILGPCIGEGGLGIVEVAHEEPWASLR